MKKGKVRKKIPLYFFPDVSESMQLRPFNLTHILYLSIRERNTHTKRKAVNKQKYMAHTPFFLFETEKKDFFLS